MDRVFETRQFLDVKGKLIGDPKYRPSDEQLVAIYKAMWKARVVDERMITLQRQGTISFAMSSLGEEATAAASAAALEVSDWLYPQYREVACLFYRGFLVQDYVHHMFCNGKDLLKGRQMPNHFGSKELNVVTVSSPIGTKISHVAGCAYAMKIQKEKSVALCYFGEGATSEGDFHAGLNFAAVLKAPAIFFCRNNGFAISTGCTKQFSSDGIAPKALAYGMEAIRVDGNDVFAVFDATREAKERCLKGEGPFLIEAMTYRMGAHSTSDDPTQYRPSGELEEWALKCPILRLKLYLMDKSLWDEEQEELLVSTLQVEVTEAINTAKKTEKPHFHSLIEDVYEEVPTVLEEQLEEVKRCLS
jgi:2-oxoisovalerate dehydrogenase E1 component alpha subunit